MPLKTKIVLSDKELTLIKNDDWILTKQVIIAKIYDMLNQCIEIIDDHMPFKTGVGTDFPTQPPKIYKGENYLGLPYITLDHPRLFNNEDIFAIRTMFWWGNFFSITLHVAGYYKKKFAKKIIGNYVSIPAEVFICIHKEQWHHHFNPGNFIKVPDFSFQQAVVLLEERDFIKLSIKFDLDQFNKMQELLIDGYKKILNIIA